MKLANPELTVYAIGGDGDGLAIGGGHFPHAARRNVNINYLMFDNSIYGLTKGQPSPSSPVGMKSKASPFGTVDKPLNPTLMALTYGASFVARLFAGDPKGITEALKEGTLHDGFAFFHIYSTLPDIRQSVQNVGQFEEMGTPDSRRSRSLRSAQSL